MMSQCQAPQSVEYSQCLDWVPTRIPFSDPEKLHFEHKTTAGLPQYLSRIFLEGQSSLISLRLICRACKSTSQRKLESWHAGTFPEVARFIYVISTTVAALLDGHAGLTEADAALWSKPCGPAYRNQQPRRPAMRHRRLPQRRCRQPQLKLRLPLRTRWRLRVTLPRRSAGGAAERAESAWSRLAGCRRCSSRRETRPRR